MDGYLRPCLRAERVQNRAFAVTPEQFKEFVGLAPPKKYNPASRDGLATSRGVSMVRTV